jgi:hypothetical protein
MRKPVIVALVALALAAAAGLAVLFARGGNGTASTDAASKTIASTVAKRPSQRPGLVRLAERSTGTLQAPVQDAAAAPVGSGRAMLVGGLTAADFSRADIRLASRSGDRAAGMLPLAVHDTAAVPLGGDVYVFGGGTNSGSTASSPGGRAEARMWSRGSPSRFATPPSPRPTAGS